MRSDFQEPANRDYTDPFLRRPSNESAEGMDSEVHVFRNGVVCETDSRGHATPNNRAIAELIVDASEGFIPLWASNTTLRWRFQERSMRVFQNPAAAKAHIERLLGEAILLWGDAAPVKFARRQDAWDFEIVVREEDRCNINGCVLASAFFPDAGRHELVIYPKMFEQNRVEQVETLAHEIGHAFGLRHFFAKLTEEAFPSVEFGTQSPFSIMNYGSQSMLTDADRSDLKRLYQAARSGQLTTINGTPIKLVRPFHLAGTMPDALVAVAQAPTVMPGPAPLGYMSGV
jgi:hypothetical protein